MADTTQKNTITEISPLMSVRLENGSQMTIRCKDWTAAEDFVWTFEGVGGLNRTANLHDCGTISKTIADSALTYEMPKTLYKACGDDTAPVNFNGSYFGANHAMTGATQISVVSHSLTESDIGSTWVDSDPMDQRCYMLVRIDSATELTFVNLDEEVVSGNGPLNYKKHNPVSPLLHKKNAVHTSEIAFDSFVNSVQLHPGVNHVQNRYYVDDTEITEDGLYTGNKVQNICAYDVIYIPAMLKHLEENIGNNTNHSYHSDEIQEKYMRIEVIHEFRPNGSQTTYCKYQVDSRSSLEFSTIYTAQVNAFDKPAHFYVPGTYQDAVILHPGEKAICFTHDTWNDKAVPPYRHFIFNTERDKGFEIAFSQKTFWGKPDNRLGRVNSNVFPGSCWSPYTCKLYPLWTSGTFEAGSSFDSITGRIPLNMALNNGTTAVGWYWENEDVILTVDSHAICDAHIPLPDYLHGKRIEILDATGSVVSTLPDRIGETLHYATNTDIGHLVIKLYD